MNVATRMSCDRRRAHLNSNREGGATMMTMKTRALVTAGLLLAAPLAAHAQDDVIASVAQASVTQADIAGVLKAVNAEGRERLAADPAALDQVVRATLAQKAVLAEAKSKAGRRTRRCRRRSSRRGATSSRAVISHPSVRRLPTIRRCRDPVRIRAEPRGAHYAACAARRPDLPRGAVERGRRDAGSRSQTGGRSREPCAQRRFRGACAGEFAGRRERGERRRSRFRTGFADAAGRCGRRPTR
jgi:hypothetical protein